MKLGGLLLCALLASAPVFAGSGEWKSLFNGKDLSGWEPYVSFQPETNEYNLVSRHQPHGLNNDPNHIFSVVDGLLRVSGAEWGGLTSVEEFENFHLKFDIKWGKQKWHPRLDVVRDSGLLYFAVGAQGAQSGHWMRSHEFQVIEITGEHMIVYTPDSQYAANRCKRATVAITTVSMV